MIQDKSNFLNRAVVALLAAVFFCAPLAGCGKPPEKPPEEIEKNRVEHGNQAQRELSDG